MKYIKIFEDYNSREDLYNYISKKYNFVEALVGAVIDVAEENFNDGKMLIPIDDYYIITDYKGNPELDKNGTIFKGKMPLKQLEILKAYWEYKKLNIPSLTQNKYLDSLT